MSGSGVDHLFAGIAVSDYRSALEWYTMVFGRQPDVVVTENHESMWQVREHAWVYVVVDAMRAGKSLVTILVDDIEAHVSALSDRGIAGLDLLIAPGLYRKVELSDGDGNKVTFADVPVPHSSTKRAQP
jgi:hypothetical protein